MTLTNTLRDYSIGQVLGKGSFAVVYKAEHKVEYAKSLGTNYIYAVYQPTKKTVAIKSIKPKLILNADTMRYVETEIEIMRNVRHPHLISCRDYIVISYFMPNNTFTKLILLEIEFACISCYGILLNGRSQWLYQKYLPKSRNARIHSFAFSRSIR